MNNVSKRCTKCAQDKPISEFRIHKGKPYCHCSKCHSESSRAYRLKNPEKCKATQRAAGIKYALANPRSKEYRKQWRDHNAAGLAAKAREYYKNNLEKVKELTRANRERNPNAFQDRYRRWAKRNPHKLVANMARRRAHKLSATPSWMTDDDKKLILCIYKNSRELSESTGEKYCVDHIVPLVSKIVCGLHVPWNLRAIKSKENERKRNILIQDIAA